MPDVVLIPAKRPPEQMAWIEARAKLAALEPMVRLEATRARWTKDARLAIFEAVRKLPNWQHPGGWYTHTRATTTLRYGGSCADKTILVGALAVACGILWRAVWVEAPPELGSDRDHVAPQFCESGQCWWADPSWTRAAYRESPVLLIEKALGQDQHVRVHDAVRSNSTR